MTTAAIKATYSDYRRVKGRKVLQLIFEVPIEQAPEVHKTFGEPAPDGSMWVAIARLAEEPKAEKPKRQWSDMPRSQQAGIACEDNQFASYIWARTANLDIAEWTPVEAVRKVCGVNSRSHLDSDPIAADKWDRLYSDFQLWKRGAAA